MIKIGFFDTKPYDKKWFSQINEKYGFNIKFYESKLNPDTASMSKGCEAVIAFVNDTINQEVIDILVQNGVKLIAMRCAGYNNIDFKYAYGRIHVVRVPDYSPYAVAEHALAMLLTLNRKIHRAYIRTKEFNFNISGLEGFDVHGKTVGVIGTGKIGRTFMNVIAGLGPKIIAYDPYPVPNSDINYVSLETLFKESDIISLHCPLSKDTRYIINKETLSQMKDGVFIINTSRGALIDSEALLEAIKERKVGGACLDVYEEESDLFFEDASGEILDDDVLARLISMPNVIITSHQAFLTNEALNNIAETTLKNIDEFINGNPLQNELCYKCISKMYDKTHKEKRCFEIGCEVLK